MEALAIGGGISGSHWFNIKEAPPAHKVGNAIGYKLLMALATGYISSPPVMRIATFAPFNLYMYIYIVQRQLCRSLNCNI